MGFCHEVGFGLTKDERQAMPEGAESGAISGAREWLGHAGSLPLSSSDSVLTVHVQHMDDFKIFQDVPFFGTYPLVICYIALENHHF